MTNTHDTTRLSNHRQSIGSQQRNQGDRTPSSRGTVQPVPGATLSLSLAFLLRQGAPLPWLGDITMEPVGDNYARGNNNSSSNNHNNASEEQPPIIPLMDLNREDQCALLDRVVTIIDQMSSD